ncbi:MAG: alpha/beta fold hydrolase, partial [Spirochaetaceae bacterium]|nr:alpha/beta fold hydrolase [Spirochaetaceae bacterium]
MSLVFQSFGDGRPIVLLHGLFGSGDNLRVLARGLESRYRVLLPDLPNHGNSPHSNSSTHEAMADAVQEFIHEQSLADPILAGHSVGGKLAMLISLRHPERVPALISIDMAPRRYEASHLEIIAGMRELPLNAIGGRRDADQALAEAVPNATVRAFFLKNLVRDGERYRWRLNLDAIATDYDALLGWKPSDATFDGPALFVGGEHSRYLQEE